MSNLIEKLISAEQILLDTTLQSYSPFEGRDRAMMQYADMLMEVMKSIPEEDAEGAEYPVEYERLALSEGTLQAIDRAFAGNREFRNKPVTDEHILQAREFFQEHYAFDVSKVPVRISRVPQTESVEGFFMPCGIADGTVFLPSVFFSPVELIVHEIGHAMHTTIRRQQRPTDYRFWMEWHPIGSEMCAYHAQFSYLFKHGTREQFYVALGALLAKVSQLLCLSGVNSQMSLADFEKLAQVQAYRNTGAWQALLDIYRRIHPKHTNSKLNRAVAARECFSGMGLALALKLIDEPDGLFAWRIQI